MFLLQEKLFECGASVIKNIAAFCFYYIILQSKQARTDPNTAQIRAIGIAYKSFFTFVWEI